MGDATERGKNVFTMTKRSVNSFQTHKRLRTKKFHKFKFRGAPALIWGNIPEAKRECTARTDYSDFLLRHLHIATPKKGMKKRAGKVRTRTKFLRASWHNAQKKRLLASYFLWDTKQEGSTELATTANDDSVGSSFYQGSKWWMKSHVRFNTLGNVFTRKWERGRWRNTAWRPPN